MHDAWSQAPSICKPYKCLPRLPTLKSSTCFSRPLHLHTPSTPAARFACVLHFIPSVDNMTILSDPIPPSHFPPAIPSVPATHSPLLPAIPVARESQHDGLLSLLLEALSRPSNPTALYVCGTPGTGKTMTVKAVLQNLREGMESENRPEHQQIFINCATLSSASHLLNVLVESFSLSKGTDAPYALRNFAVSRGDCSLVIVDEIDLLVSQGHSSSLYALFELAALPHSRISVLAIANAIDLPTRLLPHLANSMARPTHITFHPYDVPALMEIARVCIPNCEQELPAIALTLAAKKVAAAGGDARLMLNVCAHTISQKRQGDDRSALAIVSTVASGKGAASRAVETIKALPTQQQIALCVAANAVSFFNRADGGPSRSSSTRQKRSTLGGLYTSFKRMCERMMVPVVPFDEFCDFCCGALAQQALLDIGCKTRGRAVATLAARSVRLRVPVEDVREGVADKSILQKLISNA